MTLPQADLSEADVLAIRAMISGTASPDQQRRGMAAIGAKMCRIFDSPYISDGPDRDVFTMIGRHQVGVMISACNTPETLERAVAADLAKANRPAGPPKPRRGKTK